MGSGQSPGRIRILVYFELENRTWGNIFYKRPKKKTAVSARSAGTTFNNLHQQKIPGGYGLVQQVRGPTHDTGGTSDVVCTRDDLPAPTVDVIDVGLSDHCLLRWSSCLLRPRSTTGLRHVKS